MLEISTVLSLIKQCVWRSQISIGWSKETLHLILNQAKSSHLFSVKVILQCSMVTTVKMSSVTHAFSLWASVTLEDNWCYTAHIRRKLTQKVENHSQRSHSLCAITYWLLYKQWQWDLMPVLCSLCKLPFFIDEYYSIFFWNVVHLTWIHSYFTNYVILVLTFLLMGWKKYSREFKNNYSWGCGPLKSLVWGTLRGSSALNSYFDRSIF